MSAQRHARLSAGSSLSSLPGARCCSSIRTSGHGKAKRARLADLARDRGIEPVTLAGDDGLEALIQGVLASGADALGVAGGDGSLAVVASVGAARGIPFVCIPRRYAQPLRPQCRRRAG